MKTLNKIIATSLALIISVGTAFAEDKTVVIQDEIKWGGLTEQQKVIDTATKNDRIVVVLHTPGGSAVDAAKFCVAVHNSKAKLIVAYIPRYAASAGADIATCTDGIVMDKGAQLLYHVGQAGGRVLSADMDKSKLTLELNRYLEFRVSFLKYELDGLNAPEKVIGTAIIGDDGVTINDAEFHQFDPLGKGLRKDKVLYGYFLELLNMDKLGGL